MKKSLFLLSVLVLAQTASAATIFIDTFNTDQFLTVGPGGVNPLNGTSGVVIGGEGLGGFRTFSITRTTGNSGDSGNAISGLLEMNLAAADNGNLLVIWDGDTNPALNQAGIAPVDLTDGGANVQIGMSLRSDLVAPVTITFYSGNGNFSSATINTPALGFVAPFTQYVILMSSFAVGGGTGANFSAITAATLYLDGTTQPGVDIQLDGLYATTTVPEPATFGFVLVGLAGLYVRRLKARKA